MKRLIPLLPLVLLAACETTQGPPPPPHRAAPPPAASGPADELAAFAWSSQTGTNGIVGTVGWRTKASAYSCAGGSVGLTPDAPASARRTEKLYGSSEHAVDTLAAVRARSAGEAAPAYGEYVRSARCGDDGRFAFTDLPDGSWFLIVRAHPLKGAGEEMVIMQRVETGGGATRTLALH